MQTGRSVLFRCKLKMTSNIVSSSSISSSSISNPQQLYLLRVMRPWLPRAGSRERIARVVGKQRCIGTCYTVTRKLLCDVSRHIFIHALGLPSHRFSRGLRLGEMSLGSMSQVRDSVCDVADVADDDGTVDCCEV